MRKYWRVGWNVSEGSNGLDGTRRKRKVVKRVMIQLHYSCHLLLRNQGLESDCFYTSDFGMEDQCAFCDEG
jgi:hypothetical protein